MIFVNQTEVCRQVLANEIQKAVNEATVQAVDKIRFIVIALFLSNIAYYIITMYLRKKEMEGTPRIIWLYRAEKVYFAFNLTVSAFLFFLVLIPGFL